MVYEILTLSLSHSHSLFLSLFLSLSLSLSQTAEVSDMKYMGSLGDTGLDKVLPHMTDETCE